MIFTENPVALSFTGLSSDGSLEDLQAAFSDSLWASMGFNPEDVVRFLFGD
jgi:hypothetical protein